MVRLSELLGEINATVQNNTKEQLWLILLMNCYTNVNMLTFSPAQLGIILIAHLHTLIF